MYITPARAQLHTVQIFAMHALESSFFPRRGLLTKSFRICSIEFMLHKLFKFAISQLAPLRLLRFVGPDQDRLKLLPSAARHSDARAELEYSERGLAFDLCLSSNPYSCSSASLIRSPQRGSR